MARGGYGGGGVPLHARARQDLSASLSSTEPPECPVKHCWVTHPIDGGRPRPGLLMEWRRDAAGRWEGRVVYAAELRPGRWASVEEWMPADLLLAP